MADRPLLHGDRVVLIDGSALIFRAFFTSKMLTRPSDGLPVNAIYGVTTMLWRMLTTTTLPPFTHAAVILDAPGRTFRHDIDGGYKANRTAHPSDLTRQRPLIYEAITALGLAQVKAPGFEADDVIATYTRRAVEAGADVVIVSADKDMMQLVTDQVSLYDSQHRAGQENGKWWTPAAVEAAWGVPPALLGDLLALTGDTSDGIPGIPGVGPTTAAAMLREHGDLEGVLGASGKGQRWLNVSMFADTARAARKLVTLRDDVEGIYPIESIGFAGVETAPLIEFCAKVEFGGFLQKVLAWNNRA